MKLAVEQILILNAIIYLRDFEIKKRSESLIGKSVYDFAMDFRCEGFPEDDLPGEMNETEFSYIVNTIKRNKKIFEKVIIQNVENKQVGNKRVEGKDHESKKVVSGTFTVGKDIYVVYKGTAGALEWRDNGELGYEDRTDTRQQIVALKYYDKMVNLLAEEDDVSIWVSGHSKGGNKAQYVGIKRGDDARLKGVYSFDGPGFNRSFHEKYKREIINNAHKIIGISSDSDFVNILFKSGAKSEVFIEGSTTKGESKKRDNILAHRFGGYHSIFAMFRVMENQVVLGDIVPQNEAMRVLHLLLWEYQKKLRTDDLKYFYYTLSSMMMEKCLVKEYGEDFSQMPKGFVGRITRTTREFLRGNREKYKKVFREEIQPALKQMGIILLLGNAEKMPAKKIRKIIEREKEDSQEK